MELDFVFLCFYIIGSFVVVIINKYEATVYKAEFTFLEFMVSCLLSWFSVLLWLITLWLLQIFKGR